MSMWDLLLNQDESMIVDALRTYLSEQCPLEHLRPNASSINKGRLHQGINELGWLGIGLPADVGGSELRLVDEMLVQRECARYLVSPWSLATVLGAHVAVTAGNKALARQFIEGAASCALTVMVDAPSTSSPRVYSFDREEDSFLLAWNDKGMGLFHSTELMDACSEECLDDSLTLDSGTLSIEGAVHWLTEEQQPLALRAQVMLAAALIGLAEHACDLTVEYAKVREQYGKPIGTFQAVKHRCADMGVRTRLAWYQTCLAALKVQTSSPDAAAQAAGAKFLAAQAAHENSRAAIQLHGGMGFQAECDVHWFMKRAHVYDQAGGSMQMQARHLARAPSCIFQQTSGPGSYR